MIARLVIVSTKLFTFPWWFTVMMFVMFLFIKSVRFVEPIGFNSSCKLQAVF
jgi:hypothetical protein